MHKTLEHQLKKFAPGLDTSAGEIAKLLEIVNKSYENFDEDRKLLNRSLELSSKEFVETNDKLLQSNNQIALEKTKDDAILENIGDGLLITDRQGKIVLVNPSAETLLGYNKAEILSENFTTMLTAYDERNKRIDNENSPLVEALQKKVRISTVNTITRKDGTVVVLGVIVSPYIVNGQIEGAVIAFRDITKEKEIDKAKTEFVSLASHQLRTPLSTIRWYTETLLSGEMGKFTEEQLDYLKEIFNANLRMTKLVRDLLDISRIDLGTMSIEPENMNISDVAEVVLKDLAPSITARAQTVTKNFDQLPPAYNDPKIVQIIFQNLLTNAVKYTPKGGKIDITISYDTKDPENFGLVVADSGMGIPKEQQDKIFQKLFRADNVKEMETDGTGLGLYLVKSVVDHLGGSISFKSEVNKGTTFTINLPLRINKLEAIKKIS